MRLFDGCLTIPARHGRALRVGRGSFVKVVNTFGSQVVDTWAFVDGDTREFLSMDHTRSVNSNIFVGNGSALVSGERRPMLTVVEDTSPGRHDTLLCPCNAAIYRELGVDGHHRSCTENLHEALGHLALEAPFTPASLNLFMNVPVAADGAVQRHPPASKKGDYVVLRADMDLVVVFSACPQDITPINGEARQPRDIEVSIALPVATERQP